MGKETWISVGKVSAAIAAIALLLGADFQGYAQQRSDMADVRAEMRGGFAMISGRLDDIGRDVANLRERVARIEGHLALPADMDVQANAQQEFPQEG